MSRRNAAKKREVSGDPVYSSRLVALVIQHILKKGKKALAYRIMYDTLQVIKEKTQENPLRILESAVRYSTPLLEVKSRRVGGSTYQVPNEVPSSRGTALALRWLLSSARQRPGRDMVTKLSNELMDAANQQGGAVRKREEMHRMAEANKAFANFRF
jgi:small subunit ribosomal protein S7